jgi:plastocyanin
VKRVLLAVVVVAAWIAFAGGDASAATGAVGMRSDAFQTGACPSPSGGNTITVNAGDTVKWTNCDNHPHTVTSDTSAWPSHSVTGGKFVTETFPNAGTFKYHCTIHFGMKGTVIVKSGGGTTTTTMLNKKPIAKYTIDKTMGVHPLGVKVDASTSTDPDGTIAKFTWKWGDGTANSTGAVQTHTYTTVGNFTLLLTVVDNKGARGTTTKPIKVT